MPDAATTSCGASIRVPATSTRSASKSGTRRSAGGAQSGDDAAAAASEPQGSQAEGAAAVHRPTRDGGAAQQLQQLAGGDVQVAGAHRQAQVAGAQLGGDGIHHVRAVGDVAHVRAGGLRMCARIISPVTPSIGCSRAA